MITAKTADESTIRLLLAGRNEKVLTVYTDGFRAYDLLDEDDAFDHEYVVHVDGEYADDVGPRQHLQESRGADAIVAFTPSRYLEG